jgi:hypothetical protein
MLPALFWRKTHQSTCPYTSPSHAINTMSRELTQGPRIPIKHTIFGGQTSLSESNESLASVPMERGSSNVVLDPGAEFTDTILTQVQEEKTLAEDTYSIFLSKGHEFNEASRILCGNEPKSCNLRGLLLGRKRSEGATLEELWNLKMIQDPLSSNLVFLLDDTGGKITPTAAISSVEDYGALLAQLIKQVTDAMTKFFPKEEMFRLKRCGVINEGVVLALHGLEKMQLTFLSQTSGFTSIPMPVLHEMLYYCLEKSNKGSRKTPITKCHAKDAYNKFVVKSRKQAVPEIDLVKEAQDFGAILPQLCKEGYEMLVPRYSKDPAALPHGWEVRAYNTTIKGKNGDTSIRPFQVCVVHDFAPPHQFKKEIVDGINELNFLIGARGKEGAYLRACSSLEHPAPFTIGPTIYSGVAAESIEKKILSLANHICAGQKHFIESKLGGKEYNVTFAANQVLTVVASLHQALFSYHSDYSERLCSLQHVPRYKVNENQSLPRREELQVLTFVVSNSTAEESSTLEYIDSRDELIGSVGLSSFCLHWQGPGSQAIGIKHHVVAGKMATKDKGDDGEDNIWRAHFTCRFTLDPVKHCAVFEQQIKKEIGHLPSPSHYKANYNVVGVLHQILNSELVECNMSNCSDAPPPKKQRLLRVNMGVTHVDPFEVTYISTVDLSSPAYRDTFRNIEPAQFDKLKLFRPQQTIVFQGTVVDHLRTPQMMMDLFDLGYIIDIIPANSDKPIPLLHCMRSRLPASLAGGRSTLEKPKGRRFPLPGERFPAQNICQLAGLPHNSQSHPIFSTKEDTPNIFILSKSYKNILATFEKYHSHLADWSQDRRQPFLTDDFDGNISICGSGGSPIRLGTTPANYKKDQKSDPTVTIPFSQNFDSPINVALRQLAETDQVVAVYVREDMMFPKSKAPKNSCQFWGLFRVKSCEILTEVETSVIDNKSKMAEEADEHLARYRLVPHIQLNLKPLFSNKQLQFIMENNVMDEPPYTVLKVSQGCTDQLRVEIPTGKLEASLSLGNDRITQACLGRAFIQQYGALHGHLPMEDAVVDDDDVEEQPPRGISKITLREMVHFSMYVNAAGAMRYNGDCLKDPTDSDSPAQPLPTESLPVSLRLHPTPMSNRTLDVNSLFLREVVLASGLFERTNTAVFGERIKYVPELKQDLINFTFQATLLRFTGRVSHFRTYSHFTSAKEMIPIPSQLTSFLNFVELTVKQKCTMGQWFSLQHRSCIPRPMEYFPGFKSAFQVIAAEILHIVQLMLEQQQLNRAGAIKLLTKFLQDSCDEGTYNKLQWMAQQIVADVDEVFEYPFGLPVATDIQPGHGSAIGHSFLCVAEGNHTFSEGIQRMIDHIQNGEHPKPLLDMKGLCTQDGGIVVHKINGRPYDATDPEHEYCKGYHVGKLNFGQYSGSRYPRLTKPWCHPVKHQVAGAVPSYDMQGIVDPIMRDIIEAYYKCTNYSSSQLATVLKLDIPELCLRPGETEWNNTWCGNDE